MAEKRKLQILDGASKIAPSRLKLVTLNAAYVPLCDLREASQVIIEASRAALKSLGVTNYVLKLEDNVKDWRVGHKPHTHTIVSVPSGGSGFISPADWQAEWHDHLPARLHPVQNAADVRSIGDLGSRAGYVAKSPFAKSALQSQDALDRTLAGIIEMQGLQTFNLRGAFRAA
jgi:hypothetical protein